MEVASNEISVTQMAEELRNRPDPDPTLLTTEHLLRAIASLREEVKGWTDSLQRLLESSIKGREDYYDEKFASIQIQFRERDVRIEQTAAQLRLAVDQTAAGVALGVDKALQAQKEAAGEQAKSFSAATTKSETAMNRQIEGLDGKITDVKDRLNRVEAMSVGVSHNRADSQQETALRQHGSQNIFAAVSAGASIIAILISLAVLLFTMTRPSSVSYGDSQPHHIISPRI
jgi:hypothetical protein